MKLWPIWTSIPSKSTVFIDLLSVHIHLLPFLIPALEASPANQKAVTTQGQGEIFSQRQMGHKWARWKKVCAPSTTVCHICRTPPTHWRASHHSYCPCNTYARFSHILGVKSLSRRVLFRAKISNGMGHELTSSKWLLHAVLSHTQIHKVICESYLANIK